MVKSCYKFQIRQCHTGDAIEILAPENLRRQPSLFGLWVLQGFFHPIKGFNVLQFPLQGFTPCKSHYQKRKPITIYQIGGIFFKIPLYLIGYFLKKYESGFFRFRDIINSFKYIFMIFSKILSHVSTIYDYLIALYFY